VQGTTGIADRRPALRHGRQTAPMVRRNSGHIEQEVSTARFQQHADLAEQQITPNPREIARGR
jgi:hypothetical protein